MKKAKFLSLLIIFALIVSAVAAPYAMALEDPDIQAASAVVADRETGRVLYEKNGDLSRAPASLTKIMTAVLAAEALDNGTVTLDEIITVSDTANFDITDDSATQNLSAGEEITFSNLLYCALVANANEACNIIAERVSGSTEEFVNLMNAEAARLGCENTCFKNPHGLTQDGHYTTARDMAAIMAEALKYPLLREIMATKAYTVPATNLSGPREFVNTNALINPDSEYYFKDCLGGKTGVTSASGLCLASYAERSGAAIICVVLGAESVQTETGTRMNNFYESARLYEWCFSNYPVRTILSPDEEITKLDVERGKNADSVALVPERCLTALIPADIKDEDFERTVTLYSQNGSAAVTAPVNAGDAFGEVTVSLNGESYGTVKLVAKDSVELSKLTFAKVAGITFACLAAVAVILFIIFVVKNYMKHKRLEKRFALEAERNKPKPEPEDRPKPVTFEDFYNLQK